jgi:hypothetical protein
MYGQKALDSDYEFTRLMIEATPSQVNLTTPEKDAIRTSTLLTMKAIAVPVDSGIFNVRTEGFKGFQYGDPAGHPKRIVVDLFSDERSLEIIFSRKDKTPLNVSQPEVNRVVMTLQKSSAGSEKPASKADPTARTQPGT